MTDRMGGMLLDPVPAVIDAVLAQLDDPDDPEHPDVSLTHESEWSLSVFQSGLLVWENVEDPEVEPRHMASVERSEVRRLWALLAEGDLGAVNAEDWQPGYR